MHRILGTLLALALMSAGLCITASAPAQAADYYGDSARSVAHHIGCKRFRHTGSGEYNRDGGICWVKGKRVNVLTFRGPRKQRDWNAVAKYVFNGDFWWANGKGAIVVARNGNKPAARIGARRLPGELVHGRAG